jgi:porin
LIMRFLLVLFALSLASAPALANEDGLRFEVAYTADLLAGGNRSRPDYVDNLDLSLDAQNHDTKLHLHALYNNGRDFSGSHFARDYVASNIETGVKALRLYEAWVEHTLAEGRISILAGLYDLNSEFDALEASSLFINPAHGIGTDFSQSGANGPSIFPVTSFAARVQLRLPKKLTIRTAILDGVPGDPTAPKRTAIKFRKGDGALVVTEADKQLSRWRLIAGYWRYTARFEDVLASQTFATSVKRRGNQGFYLRGEGLIFGEQAGRNMRGFFRLGRASGRFNEVRDFVSGGFSLTGLLARRPKDEAGIAFALAGSSAHARRLQRQLGAPIARNEWSIEATYALKLADWLTIQPDIQYLLNPAFERERKALVGGVRVTVTREF